MSIDPVSWSAPVGVRPIAAVRAPVRVEPAGSVQARVAATAAAADRAIDRELGLAGARKGRVVDIRA